MAPKKKDKKKEEAVEDIGPLDGTGTFTITTARGEARYVGSFLKVEEKKQGQDDGDQQDGPATEWVMKQNGQGTLEYGESGEKFQGEWSLGEIVQGTYTFENGDVYVGEFSHGMFQGKGRMELTNGDLYVGEFKNGKMDGFGELTLKSENQRWIGSFIDGKPDRVKGYSLKLVQDAKTLPPMLRHLVVEDDK